jgi:hypothetical protein
MITKTSTVQSDYETLRKATDDRIRCFDFNEQFLKCCIKLNNIWKKLEKKYNYRHDEINNVDEIPKHFLEFIQKGTMA